MKLKFQAKVHRLAASLHGILREALEAYAEWHYDAFLRSTKKSQDRLDAQLQSFEKYREARSNELLQLQTKADDAYGYALLRADELKTQATAITRDAARRRQATLEALNIQRNDLNKEKP